MNPRLGYLVLALAALLALGSSAAIVVLPREHPRRHLACAEYVLGPTPLYRCDDGNVYGPSGVVGPWTAQPPLPAR